jgi:hypothetical protein
MIGSQDDDSSRTRLNALLSSAKRNLFSAVQKRDLWATYVGVHAQQAPCPLCGRVIIYQEKCRFEAAHVVARSYNNDSREIYYGVPSCSPCNNLMGTRNALDFMWESGYVASLRAFVMRVRDAYVERNDVPPDEQYAHLVLDRLYGDRRWPLGGGMVHRREILQLARAEELARDNAQLQADVAAVQRRIYRIQHLVGPPQN